MLTDNWCAAGTVALWWVAERRVQVRVTMRMESSYLRYVVKRIVRFIPGWCAPVSRDQLDLYVVQAGV